MRKGQLFRFITVQPCPPFSILCGQFHLGKKEQLVEMSRNRLNLITLSTLLQLLIKLTLVSLLPRCLIHWIESELNFHWLDLTGRDTSHNSDLIWKVCVRLTVSSDNTMGDFPCWNNINKYRHKAIKTRSVIKRINEFHSLSLSKSFWDTKVF